MSGTVVVTDDPTVVVTPEQSISVVQADPQIVITPEEHTNVLTVPADVIVVNAGTGPQGPPGSGGGGAYYEHTQSIPAATWVITHNIGRKVSVTVYDADGDPYLADVHTNSPNSTSVIFTTPTSGSALVL